jgi:hypothetical protein
MRFFLKYISTPQLFKIQYISSTGISVIIPLHLYTIYNRHTLRNFFLMTLYRHMLYPLL